MRSDNLRGAPAWITPRMVQQVLELANRAPPASQPIPVTPVPTPRVRPTMTIISETSSVPPPGAKIRSGEDGPRERQGAVSRQSSGTVRTVPAKPASPTPNPPVASTHSRRPEESEAAIHGPTSAASPRRAKLPRHDWLAHRNSRRRAEAKATIEADRPAFQIAYDRGISIADLARALEQKESTISLHTREAGFRFGRRAQLADRLTREQLMALADPAIPVPELRSVRLKRERLAKWAKFKRDKRAADVARRRQERAAAAERRQQEREAAKAERLRRRDQERAERAAKAAPKKKNCEVKKATICRPVVPSPSREPASDPSPRMRAQPIVLKPTPGAPRFVNYAERMNGAVAYLRARGFVVQRHSREEIIARWHVSGWTGLFSNEQLMQLAEHYGLELHA